MKQVFTLNQVEIDFVGGLVDQFPEFKDVVKASVYSCGRQFKAIAADLDMSVSELSRRLSENANDSIGCFPLKELPALIAATGDKRPIYWLLEKFVEDKSVKRQRAMDALPELMERISQVLKVAKEA